MNSGLATLLLLCLAGFMIFGIVYIGEHDTVTEVMDVNAIKLKKGRVVNLAGVAPSKVFETVSAEESGQEGGGGGDVAESADFATPEVVDMDEASISAIKELVLDNNIRLEFIPDFEPDTASIDLVAYVVLDDGMDLNGWIIGKGLAKVMVEHQHPRSEIYMELQRDARAEGLGIWKNEVKLLNAPDVADMMQDQDGKEDTGTVKEASE